MEDDNNPKNRVWTDWGTSCFPFGNTSDFAQVNSNAANPVICDCHDKVSYFIAKLCFKSSAAA